MKLQNLKVGDKVRHYCCGEIVNSTVTKVETNRITTEHKEVIWGNDTYVRGIIYKSLDLQYNTSQTTPGAWYKGRKLQA